MMRHSKWLYCPICKSKTRTKIRNDTVIKNFPLYCPKCKRESLVNVTKFKVEVIKMNET